MKDIFTTTGTHVHDADGSGTSISFNNFAGWNNLGIFSSVSLFTGFKLSQTLFKWVICVDARYGVADLTASQTTIDKFTSVNPVPNAQVCYFNNVWFMF
jgi:hypothetical protein